MAPAGCHADAPIATLNMRRTARRLGLGAALHVLVVAGGAFDWAPGLAALLLATTSFVGTCPGYLPFDFPTRTAT